jgi:hypothetical protein
VRGAESVSRRYEVGAALVFRSRKTDLFGYHKRPGLLSVVAELVIEHVSECVAKGIMGSHRVRQSALRHSHTPSRLPRRN